MVRELAADKWLQVRAFFTPSDYTREMFSTVSRGWVIWQVILLTLFLSSSLINLFQSEWLLAFLYFLIGTLFGLIVFYELTMNMAQKTIENLFEVCREQQKTMHEMMAFIEGPTRGSEFD